MPVDLTEYTVTFQPENGEAEFTQTVWDNRKTISIMAKGNDRLEVEPSDFIKFWKYDGNSYTPVSNVAVEPGTSSAEDFTVWFEAYTPAMYDSSFKSCLGIQMVGRKPFSNLGRATSVQSDHPRGKPHDKQHVESPQGIQRQQSFFSLRVHIPTLFYTVYRQRHRFIQPNRAKKQSGRSTPTVVSPLRSISQRDTRYPFAISYTARSFRGPR